MLVEALVAAVDIMVALEELGYVLEIGQAVAVQALYQGMKDVML